MNRKEEFEKLLASIANAPVDFAGNKSPRRIRGGTTEFDPELNEEDILRELRRAKVRLKRNPSLFSGDPDGIFTYEDPILAVTAYIFQAHLLMSSVLGLADDRGSALCNESYWEWVKTGIHAWLSRNKKSYQTLMGMTPRESIRFEKDVVRIAVTGDAGFNGQAQKNVLDNIREQHRSKPYDLLIHLGDVYFAGNSGEYLNNFLAPFQSVGPRVLTLLGNHDLYFGGESVLSALDVLRQPGRYFCVENPYWRIACLDTALPAETLRRNSGLLDKGQRLWLDEQLEPDDSKKVILMSHHYIISAWEKASDGLRRQLASRLGKIFAWYWGHEHGCAIYDKKAVGFYGACVGNGAFLEVWKAPNRKPAPKWYPKGRCSCYQAKSKFWPHGYLELELQPMRVIEQYHLEGRKPYTRILKRV